MCIVLYLFTEEIKQFSVSRMCLDIIDKLPNPALLGAS